MWCVLLLLIDVFGVLILLPPHPRLRCQPPLVYFKEGQCTRVKIVKFYPATVLQQCHAMGLRLSLASYTALVVVAFVGRRSCGSRSKAASPDP
jgi:hypothetical protein